MATQNLIAPGAPGIAPRWASSAKSGVGTAIREESRVWFTVSHGIVNEVYYPRLDQANTRDLGFIVTAGATFFSEEKRHASSQIEPLAQGVPGYCLTNTCLEGRYRLNKTIITDPQRDALLQRVRFEPLNGTLADYHLYVLLAPHIGNCGYGNDGWAGEYKGLPMLFAQRGGLFLALACSIPFAAMSCGYAGVSDGWQELNTHRRLSNTYSQAANGNIALTGEINLTASHGGFTLALAFGVSANEAGQLARAALLRDFDQAENEYVRGWQDYQARCLALGQVNASGFDPYRVSTAVLKTHEATIFPGALIASLSIPWGMTKGDEDLGGYHLVWPRDLVESAGALLAAGDVGGARQTLFYLMCTQEADGHWPQNMWLDGTPYWYGVQMDETAFPILLADLLRRADALDGLDPWLLVRRAAAYLVANGPATPQDRWEEDGGFSPFTLAVEIAALLAAADFFEQAAEKDAAEYLRQTADIWNDHLEQWTYVTDTELAQQLGVAGYYVRIAPLETEFAPSPATGFVPIKNRPPENSNAPAGHIVSPDALALARFGLRAPDDARLVNTVKVIDALLKTETATGPVWHRYNEDGYGEHADGSPFDGTGSGRGWPLLAGERAHYELMAGKRAAAVRLLHVMEAQASPGGLLPEQVWDAPDIPALELFNGCPAGSAMPLVWAHAEYIKLLRSLRDERVFDLPPQTVERYQRQGITSTRTSWRFNHKCRAIPVGKVLRLETLSPCRIHWSVDAWRSVTEVETADTHLNVHFADLSTALLPPQTTIVFTFFWLEAQRWEGVNYEVTINP
ncbi:MAG: glucan 1,4-alpha-glucosidase [Acidobacteria bacterium]|nr:glucan 1,4-alpha-glucosidase [Acidobacteriota bacterium]MBI3425915.1 glucan 1,4-alpha-glucosidase [Acidobacteriota bacterium]